MIVNIPGRGPLTEEESNRLFMVLFEDDTEDAPWMVMGSLQYAAASDFFQSLRGYAERQNKPWFVAGMTPILAKWPDMARKRQVSPDVFVAFVPDRPRSAFDAEAEGGFPPFVLEVVSPSSVDRDRDDKRVAYELLGAREYALFTPHADRPSELEGYRRNAVGQFEPWSQDSEGRLWSAVLELYLIAQGTTIRAATRDGQFIPTASEAIAALASETAAREEAEAEIERLRREIEKLRHHS